MRATQVTPLFSKQVNRQRLLFLLPLFHFLFHNKTLPSYFFRHHYFPLFPLLFLFPFSHRLSFNDLVLIHFRLPSGNARSVTEQLIHFRLPSGNARSVTEQLIHFRLPSGNARSVTEQLILLPGVPLGCEIGATHQGENI